MVTTEFLAQTQLFTNLHATVLEMLARDFRTRRFRAGEVIFLEGDPGHTLYLIKQGQVRIFVNGIGGSETSVILCGRPGQLFGELAAIDGLPRSATAVAVVDSTVYTMDSALFRHHMERAPKIALNFVRALSKKVRYNTKQVEGLASLGVSPRLARKLLELSQDYGTAEASGIRINTPLTQSDLASLIGATRESVNKVLGQFRKQGLVISQDNNIIIRDAAALREMVAV